MHTERAAKGVVFFAICAILLALVGFIPALIASVYLPASGGIELVSLVSLVISYRDFFHQLPLSILDDAHERQTLVAKSIQDYFDAEDEKRRVEDKRLEKELRSLSPAIPIGPVAIIGPYTPPQITSSQSKLTFSQALRDLVQQHDFTSREGGTLSIPGKLVVPGSIPILPGKNLSPPSKSIQLLETSTSYPANLSVYKTENDCISELATLLGGSIAAPQREPNGDIVLIDYRLHGQTLEEATILTQMEVMHQWHTLIPEQQFNIDAQYTQLEFILTGNIPVYCPKMAGIVTVRMLIDNTRPYEVGYDSSDNFDGVAYPLKKTLIMRQGNLSIGKHTVRIELCEKGGSRFSVDVNRHSERLTIAIMDPHATGEPHYLRLRVIQRKEWSDAKETGPGIF